MENCKERQRRQNAVQCMRFKRLRQRPWDLTTEGRKILHKYPNFRKKHSVYFTVVSYNVLAQNLLEDNYVLYRETDEEHGSDYLTWKFRWSLIISEIMQHRPTILCLQEVHHEHMTQFFQPRLKDAGYSGYFKQRTQDKMDGCAIFVRNDVFVCEKVVPVEYLNPKARVLDRDNVALLLRLVPRNGDQAKKLVVANTHLLFNPRRGDVKLAQLMVLLAEIDKLCHKMPQRCGDRDDCYPVVLCGDFNSEPFSDLYNFIGQGHYDYVGRLSRGVSGQKEGRHGRDVTLSHQILPPEVGISDCCRYVTELEERRKHRDRLAKRESSQPKGKSRRRQRESESRRREDAESERSAISRSGRPQRSASAAPVQPIILSNFTGAFSNAPQPGNVYANYPPVMPIMPSSYGQHFAPFAAMAPPPGLFPPFPPPQSAFSIPPQPPVTSYTQCFGALTHELNLLSAYRHVTGERPPEVTTKHGQANCTVDYIWYSVAAKRSRVSHGRLRHHDIQDGELSLLGKLRLLTDKEADEVGVLPNEVLGSDHFLLMAGFLWNHR